MSRTFPTPYVGGTQLAWMRPLSLWLRWGALAIALVLVAVGQRPVADAWLVVAAVVLAAFAAFRTFPALGSRVDLRAVLTFEPGLVVASVIVSGGFASPFAICLAVPVLFAAMALGARVAWLVLGIALLFTLHETTDDDPWAVTEVAQSFIPMLVAALVGFVARRRLRRAEDEQTRRIDRP